LRFGNQAKGEMWKGDDEWLPFLIQNKKVQGEIHFSSQGEELVSVDISTF